MGPVLVQAKLVVKTNARTLPNISFLTFQITLVIYVCLFFFEDMTATMVVCGICSQILHLTLLSSFPFFALTSPQFIVAAGKISFNKILSSYNGRIVRQEGNFLFRGGGSPHFN